MAAQKEVLFHVVLVEPEIPANAGNIGRLCLATRSALHMVRPLGFFTSDKALRRAGLDYWKDVTVYYHDSLEEVMENRDGDKRFFFTSTSGGTPYTKMHYQEGDFFVFGKESTGLPPSLLSRFPGKTITIPIIGPVRSHNLANAVSIIIYEALRQVRPELF